MGLAVRACRQKGYASNELRDTGIHFLICKMRRMDQMSYESLLVLKFCFLWFVQLS